MNAQVEPDVYPLERQVAAAPARSTGAPNWAVNLYSLWTRRRLLGRITGIAFVVSLAVSFLIPKIYVSQARLMPPENTGSHSMIAAALAQRALGSDALAGLAASLMDGRGSGALFVNMLQSGSVTSHVIERCNLLQVYGKRYRVDAAKTLARRTIIEQDKKSGVITVSVGDTDPARARDIVQAYLEGLNQVVYRTSTSPAHQERVFIEKRLQDVKRDLLHSQDVLSEFSSTHSTIDLKEQARATVESQARVQGELIAAQSELEALRETYTDADARVRTTQARIGSLQRQLANMTGSSLPLAPSSDQADGAAKGESFLPLRQIPRLAVPYANLYRDFRVQETLFDLLTQQYEVSRIQEAKDIPAVTLIDAPGIPEKKSFPPRTLLTLALTLFSVLVSCTFLLCRDSWLRIDPADPRRRLAHELGGAFRILIRAERWAR